VPHGERQLGDVLVEHGIISAEQLKAAMDEEARSGRSAVRLLVDSGAATERDVVRAQADIAGLDFVDLSVEGPEPAALSCLPHEVARRQLALPIRLNGDGTMVVAMAEPRNHLATNEVSLVSSRHVVAAVAHRPDLIAAIERAYAVAHPPAPPAHSPLDMPAPFPAQPHAQPAPMPATVSAPSTPGNGHTPGAPSLGTPFGPDDIPMTEAPAPTATVVEAVEETEKEPNFAEFLLHVIDTGSSDLHITAGLPPMVRLHGSLAPIKGYRRLMAKDLQEILYGILTQKQRELFEENLELDLSYSLPGKARFRVNVFQQRDAMGAVMRLIPFEIKPLTALGLPPSVSEFAKLKRGLVLVTGITGSGKSTTLAGLVDIINTGRSDHIMTVEDPIEFLHRHKKSVVNQREVGTDTHSFAKALKHVLRQDPDVILVGEMRDLETIQTALTAAETGHLVFGTLHTQDAPQSVDRVIDVFPPHQQQQIRVQLAGTLAGVVSQQLLPIAAGKGRAVAAEVLIATPAVRNLIREGKTHQIYTSMQAGGKFGMQVMDQHLAELVKTGKITYEIALEHSHHVEEFNRLVGKG
jgi:twitching motility protein PilT